MAICSVAPEPYDVLSLRIACTGRPSQCASVDVTLFSDVPHTHQPSELVAVTVVNRCVLAVSIRVPGMDAHGCSLTPSWTESVSATAGCRWNETWVSRVSRRVPFMQWCMRLFEC